MGIFDKFFKTNINKEVKKFNNTPGAVLLDVRNEEEYKKGHIPGSINIPESEIERVKDEIVNLSTPVYVYCLSGAKSWNATNLMKAMGYTKVINIGGINKYTGEKEKS